MAIYHMSMKPIARSGGRSAVASAAYRAAVRLKNERDGLVHDFSSRQGVEHAEIVLPAGVSGYWARKRSALWNAAERAEKRSDARVAREFEIALPHELRSDRRVALSRAFAQDLANRYGAAVDFAIHATSCCIISGLDYRHLTPIDRCMKPLSGGAVAFAGRPAS